MDWAQSQPVRVLPLKAEKAKETNKQTLDDFWEAQDTGGVHPPTGVNSSQVAEDAAVWQP